MEVSALSEDKCFARTDEGCRALENGRCPGCKFYKTVAQVEQEKADAIERLKSLGIWDYMRVKYNIKGKKGGGANADT